MPYIGTPKTTNALKTLLSLREREKDRSEQRQYREKQFGLAERRQNALEEERRSAEDYRQERLRLEKERQNMLRTEHETAMPGLEADKTMKILNLQKRYLDNVQDLEDYGSFQPWFTKKFGVNEHYLPGPDKFGKPGDPEAEKAFDDWRYEASIGLAEINRLKKNKKSPTAHLYRKTEDGGVQTIEISRDDLQEKGEQYKAEGWHLGQWKAGPKGAKDNKTTQTYNKMKRIEKVLGEVSKEMSLFADMNPDNMSEDQKKTLLATVEQIANDPNVSERHRKLANEYLDLVDTLYASDDNIPDELGSAHGATKPGQQEAPQGSALSSSWKRYYRPNTQGQ